MKYKTSQAALDELCSLIAGYDVTGELSSLNMFDIAMTIIHITAEFNLVECHVLDPQNLHIIVADSESVINLSDAIGRIRQVLANLAFAIDEIRFPGSHQQPVLAPDPNKIQRREIPELIGVSNPHLIDMEEISMIMSQVRLISAHKRNLSKQGVRWLNIYGFDVTFTYQDELTTSSEFNVKTENTNRLPCFFISKKIER